MAGVKIKIIIITVFWDCLNAITAGLPFTLPRNRESSVAGRLQSLCFSIFGRDKNEKAK
jgi:hypothetical protein